MNKIKTESVNIKGICKVKSYHMNLKMRFSPNGYKNTKKKVKNPKAQEVSMDKMIDLISYAFLSRNAY